MEFTKKTPIIVQAFHYDLNEQNKTSDQVNVALLPVTSTDQADKNDDYFQVDVKFEVAPDPGIFTVSGEIKQVVEINGYHGDGHDLKPEDYQLLSRPLVEYIETLTYEVTQVTLDQPVNLSFTANFK
jgi:hypothetical protein